MLNPEIFAVLRRKINCLLSVARNALINGDRGNTGPGESHLELVENHEKCEAVLPSRHRHSNMVIGAEHVPVTDSSTDFSFQRVSKAALAYNLPLVLSSELR